MNISDGHPTPKALDEVWSVEEVAQAKMDSDELFADDNAFQDQMERIYKVLTTAFEQTRDNAVLFMLNDLHQDDPEIYTHMIRVAAWNVFHATATQLEFQNVLHEAGHVRRTAFLRGSNG